MKIGFIGSGLNLLSGSSKPIFQLMSNLEKKGFQTAMLSDHLSESICPIQDFLLEKNKLEDLNIQRIDNLLKGLLTNNKKINGEVKCWVEDCDLILTSDFLMAWLLQHNDIKIHKRFIFIASNNMNLKLRYLIESGVPSLVNIFKLSFFSKLFFQKHLLKMLLNKFDCVLATSNYIKEELIKLNLNIPVTYLPIGVNVPEKYSLLNGDENIYSYFGWGSGIRGLQDVVKSFEYYNLADGNARLRIFLQGQHGLEESYYVKRIKKSKFKDKIEINYFNKNIEEMILSSKVIILPFRIPFGYSQPPLVILESMALGRVVISTKVGCIPEIISHGSDGFLVNPAGSEEITDILIKLNNNEIDYIGRNAYKKIQDSYSWDVVVERYINLFKNFGD